jgi:surface polysaccharide O-acyltransferase-like enzyme
VTVPAPPRREEPLPSLVRNVPVIRGAAIALVILNHSVSFSLGIAGILTARPPGWPAWRSAFELLVLGLSQQCIPAFFFASGFFMYRFSRTWPAARASARSIATRYLLWSIPGYVVIAIATRSFDARAVAISLLDRGPYYGTYWFLVVLFQLSLAAPLLARWVDRSPRTALLSCLALQLTVSAVFYVRAFGGWVTEPHFVLWRVPFLLAGMLVSARSEDVVRWLVERRRKVAAVALLCQVLPLAESVAWGLWRGDGSVTSFLFGLDKLTITIAAIAAVAWSLTLRSEPSPVRARLSTLGMSSLAILLASDLFFAATVRVVWHAGHWAGLPASPPGVAPPYMTSFWLAPLLFVAGLLGPLVAAGAVERLFGKPARRLLFG